MLFGMDNLAIAEMLGGYMAGVTVSGVLWAIFQNNAGGAWDNAKKSFEAGVEINGEMTYKGSDAHKAAVTGDTVGDPFKDTSGPSMNILIKLTCLIGLVVAPILGGHSTDEVLTTEVIEITVDAKAKFNQNSEKMFNVTVSKKENGTFKGTVNYTTTENDITITKEEVFEGTEEEVQAKIEALEKNIKITVKKTE